MTDPWQPITTAPMFRLKPPQVDLWVKRPSGNGYRVPDAYWAGNPRIWKILSHGFFEIRAYRSTDLATHWMPKPSPPREAA